MERCDKVMAMAIILLVAAIGSIDSVEGEAEAAICNMTSDGLYACKPAVTPPTPPPPTSDCCNALSHSDLHCFCAYKNSAALPSLGIDFDLALELPQKCNLPNSPNC